MNFATLEAKAAAELQRQKQEAEAREARAKADLALHGAGAALDWAVRKMGIFHRLFGLKGMAARLAFVFVSGHGGVGKELRGVAEERSRGGVCRLAPSAAKGFSPGLRSERNHCSTPAR